MKTWWLLHIGLLSCFIASSQTPDSPPWDNTIYKNWTGEFQLVQIKSHVDSVLQKAWFYSSTKTIRQPLIVSLHTWSGDYNQEDPLAKEVLLRDWNYIHPDFRGPNNNPMACGSELVIADIEDAILYAVKRGNVDINNVHIIGVSGGGYAALLAYMKLTYPVKSFNAWASISDLTSWYWESKGRNAKYATDIELVAMSEEKMNWTELYNRSPINLPAPAQRKKATLNLYTGIHDGYTGSVPITHSVLFYNKIAAALFPGKEEHLISDSTIVSLLAKRKNPDADTLQKLCTRIIHLQKQLSGLSFTLFEGGHEMLVPSALVLPPVDGNKNLGNLNILTIGDSNGSFEYGWSQQMVKLLPYSTIINKSISGNTIGFDNLDKPELNTLRNVQQYLDDAYNKISAGAELDFIFLGIGTNDAKVVFKDRQKEVVVNMNTLVQQIKNHVVAHHKKMPVICIISPPPMDEQKIDKMKYGGGDLRLQRNNRQFSKIASTNQVYFLNTYDRLKENFGIKTIDGIHLNEKTQFELAAYILSFINSIQQK